MKKPVFVALFLLAILSLNAQAREYYQLKIYTFGNKDQQELTDDYLQNAYLPTLRKLGIQNVGVFKPRPLEDGTPLQTYVLIPFKSIVEFGLLDDTIMADASHRELGKAFLDAPHDQAPFGRVESFFMKAFVDMPRMKTPKLEGPRKDRVYELRSYESATENLYRNKVDMFNAGGEIALFDRLNFNAVFYAEVLSGSRMPNLMYLTTHENQQTRDQNWEAFFGSQEWSKLKVDPKYQNNVSRNDTRLLYPTEYSDY